MSSLIVDPYANPTEWNFHDIGDEKAEEIAKRLSETPGLLMLEICGRFGEIASVPGVGLTKVGAEKIIKAVALHPSLTTLNLDGNCEISSSILPKIYKLLKRTKTLEILSLRDCGLSPKNFDFIAEGIRRNTSLKSISVNTNCINNECFGRLRNAGVERGIPLFVG